MTPSTPGTGPLARSESAQGRGLPVLLGRCVAVALVALLGGAAEGLRNLAFNMCLGGWVVGGCGSSS